MKNSFPRSIAACVLLVLAWSSLCLAQPAGTSRFLVIYTQVKPEMLTEWTDLQKNEVNPALKKAGFTQRTVWQPLFGNTYEFVSISPLDKFALFDGTNVFVRALGVEAAARLSEKTRKCITGQRLVITNRVDDLSLPPDPKNPPMVSLSTRVRVAPGKGPEYENWIKNDILPHYKKAKAEGKLMGYTVGRRSFGSSNSERTQAQYYAKFADLDGGLLLTRMLGQEAVTKLFAKAAGLSTTIETVVRRRVADLSF